MVSGSLPADDQQLADELTLIGIAVEGIDRSGLETVFEMEITTNRVDAMNHYGIARECSALYDLDLKPITPKVVEKGGEHFPIRIVEPALCARYTALVLRDVQVKASTGEIAERFAALAQKPINNAADASNYTLLEMGHPTHVFDLDKLAGGTIIVRKAKAGEKIKTLDGIERTLHEDDLVIADAEKPVAIAGVIGGEDTKVTESTRNILIESAWFDTATVRRTSKRHLIHTDASHRFERGADYNATLLACRRVAELILAQGGGEIVSPLLDNIAREIVIAPVELRLAQVRRILGKEICADEIRRILTRLGFGLRPLDDERFEVSLPTWRLDVSREIDLMEEIARVHGFNQFQNTLPAFSGGVIELPNAEKESKLRQSLLALGYNEALSNTFISREDAERFTPNQKPVELENPLSEERAVMRTSLLPGMLDMLEYNLNRDQNEVHLFEMGNTFRAEGERVAQSPALCLAFTTPNNPTDWPQGSFYRLKGAVQELLRRFDGKVAFGPNMGNGQDARTSTGTALLEGASGALLHPGRSAMVALDGDLVGLFGEVTATAYGRRKFRQPLYVAEIFVDRLNEHALRQPRYTPLSRYPAVERDFSVLLPEGVRWEQVHSAVKALNLPEMRSFDILEVFRSKAVGEGTYSALLRVVLQSPERTLREEEVAAASDRIIIALNALGGSLRTS
jgi:phenylalanyl-tRNA synthetase beta chain